ncbi:LLM class F420-dependent oxidoreductase [Streptomyces pseudovenezuelae]|uniref:F420-dependent oxidoreductase n=1 Tax=Streptomyces pseudovenezuelae TaxID=67350 RepID=A0ABT6LKU7_9ACTN|nr:LLM class F420-dependent oxidoreductase [Streptomyces pseudovenezuelae]MDH6216883.1 putative F420-dependent oxidoreductase [Streptomyces pseudovenezuelae]
MENPKSMRMGAVFPHLEIGADPGAVRAWAEAVEEIGFRHVVAFDHVLGAGTDTRPGWYGYTHEDLFHEVFVLFGYLAGITTTLELATGVLVLPQRQTALVAKQAAEVDVLSGGRLRLGVGIGWNKVEYDALGMPFAHRGARSAEQVELMRALWAEPTVTFRGRWDRVDNAGILPRPVRGTIPVWFGGNAEPVLRRAGEIGDGWLPQRPPDETARAMVGRVRSYALAAGRDPAELSFEARLVLAEVPEPKWPDFVAGWRDLGATHLCVSTMGLGLATADDHIRMLHSTLRDLGPVAGR